MPSALVKNMSTPVETTKPAVICSLAETNPVGETVAQDKSTGLNSGIRVLERRCTERQLKVPGGSSVPPAQLTSVITRTEPMGMVKGSTFVPSARILPHFLELAWLLTQSSTTWSDVDCPRWLWGKLVTNTFNSCCSGRAKAPAMKLASNKLPMTMPSFLFNQSPPAGIL